MEIRQGGRRPGRNRNSSRHLSCRRSQRSPFLELYSKLKIEDEEEEENKKQADERGFNELGARLLPLLLLLLLPSDVFTILHKS